MKRMMGTLLVLVLTATVAPAQTPAKPMDEKGCAMMKDNSAADVKLQAMLDDMNKAQGQAKVDKMAAVINELLAQRTAMQSGSCCSMMKKDAAKSGSCCSATAACCSPASSCCSTAKKESGAAMECH